MAPVVRAVPRAVLVVLGRLVVPQPSFVLSSAYDWVAWLAAAA